MSPEVVNELISMMGQSVLRKLLCNIKRVTPHWFGIIADEATDVSNREQLNLSIRWVNDNYEIFEDPVGLFALPNTSANTITEVIKDLLIRCDLPLSPCRGQAYDGAATMQGQRKGVATQIRDSNQAALPVHCFGHCLNLCLQDVGRQIPALRDALDIVREIGKLIKYSPKRSHLFSQKLAEADSDSVVTVKSLCTTRWTARTSAIDAVLKDYSILMETMSEVNETTRDEYGLKAGGILAALEKFSTLFGLRLAFLLFATAEEVSKGLQAKDTTLQQALASINLASSFYRRQRTEQAFKQFFEVTVTKAQDLQIGMPELPRYRRPPTRIDDGSRPHQFSTPQEYYRQIYYQECDLLLQELADRFDQSEFLPEVLGLESLLLKAANGDNYESELESVRNGCFASDLKLPSLQKQLPLLVDVAKQGFVRKGTSIRTISDAMNDNPSNKVLLSEIHKLLRLYLIVPVTSATSERTFSVLKRLLVYLRSTMTEKRVNNCLLVHVHKDIVDELNLKEIAVEFVSVNDERRKHFGNY